MGLKILLGFIGTITLGIGGIGLMNIMLVSVTQRTREIGVEKALGARKRDILFQFLAEALVITAVGGVFGILLSYAISLSVGTLTLYSALASHASAGDITLLVAPKTLFIATGFSPWSASPAACSPQCAPRTSIPSKPCATSRPLTNLSFRAEDDAFACGQAHA